MSDSDIAATAALLAQLEPGFLPYPIFEQVARLVVLPVVEFVPLRRGKQGIEVLLVARDANDAFWPGLLHTPGTVLRAYDLDTTPGKRWSAFQRIISDELHDTAVGEPQYVGTQFRQSIRGAEQAQLYWIEVQDDPKIGEFYPVDTLPDSLIDAQKGFIAEAVRHFKAAQSQN